MKKIHRLIISSYLGPFFITFVVTLFILVMQFLWKYVDDLMGKGLEFTVIAELLTYASASLVPMALPLAILLSSIMTFGNLAEHYELVAMKSSGLSLMRIFIPMIALILVLSAGTFYFTNHIWPVANLKFRSLLWDVTQQKPSLNLQEGIFYNGIEGYNIRVSEKNAETGELKDILIYDHSEPYKGNTTVIRAKTGIMEKTDDGRYLQLTLHDGVSYDELEPGRKHGSAYPHLRNRFEKSIIRFDLSAFDLKRTDEDLFKQNYEMLNMKQLQKVEDSLSLRLGEQVDEYEKYVKHSLLVLREKPNFEIPDTTAPLDVMNSLSYLERKRVIELATNRIRNTKSFIERKRTEFKNREQKLDRYRIEWHRKMTIPIACILLFFIGGPLGAIIKKGGFGLPVVFSVVFFLIYHVVSITGEKMVKTDVIEPIYGMWMSADVLLPIGVILTYKAANDASISIRSKLLQQIRSVFQKKPKTKH